MSKRVVSGILLTLLLIGMLTLAFNLAIAGVDEVASEDELSSSASSAPSLIWSETYGGDADDEAYCVRQTSDGGYILAGVTYSFGAGDMDVWLVKTGANGNVEWNRTYGGADLDWATSVQQTSDGGYIVAGGSRSFNGYAGPDIYVIKTDAYGNVEWNITSIGEFLQCPMVSVQQASDGGYITAGYFDPWLVKIDTNGNLEWQRPHSELGSGRDWHLKSVDNTGDGGYVVAGDVTIHTPSGSKTRGCLIKTNASGNIEWSKTYGISSVYAYSGQQTTDGGYMLAGYLIPPGELRRDYLLVKTDSNGNMEWNRTYGGENNEWGYSGQQTSDGGYILAGETIGGSPWFQVWLVKTDANGNMEWNATYGENYWAARAVQQTSGDEYIIAGFTYYYHMGGKDSDFFLMKLGIKHDIAVTDVQPSNNVVPQNNSVSINVTVENQGDATETFNVTTYASETAVDTSTGIILTSGNSATITLTWNTTSFIEGIYFLSATVPPVPSEIETADNTYVDGLVIVGAGHPGNQIWVNPPLTDNLQEGNTFVVDLMINITDPDGPGPATGLYGFEYKLAWESAKIDIVDITYHAPWPTGQWLLVKNETGVAPDGRHYNWLAITSTAGFTGTKSLCTYTFYVNYQPYHPDPDYNGRLDIYDDELVDDTATSFAHTTCDGQYRIPSKVPVHDVAITGIVLSKTVVGRGLPMHINVTVANEGDLPEPFIVTAYCNTIPIATQAIILAAGDSYTITFPWNTTGFAKGSYTINATVTPVPDETDTTDNSYIDGTVRVNMVGDVTPEYGIVDIVDLVYVAIHFGAEKGDPEYEPNADINSHGIIDIVDIVIVAIHFGETDS